MLELQAIVRLGAFGLIRKPMFIKGFIQQHPSIVAGKRTPGAIGAVHAGRKPYDQQLGLGNAKRQHRACVVIRLLFTHLRQKTRESRAFLARQQRGIAHGRPRTLSKQIAFALADGLHRQQRALIFCHACERGHVVYRAASTHAGKARLPHGWHLVVETRE